MLVGADEILIKTRETGAFQRPSNRDYTSVITWFNNWKPLVKKEWYSLQQWQDMLTLRQGREWAGFDGFVERMLTKCEESFIDSYLFAADIPAARPAGED